MPNHVENDLKVSGDQETLRAFVAFARLPEGERRIEEPDQLLGAHQFIPYPDEYDIHRFKCSKCQFEFTGKGDISLLCPQCKEAGKDGYNRGGYDWCIEHWGTKWGLYDVSLVGGEPVSEHLDYVFMTAWSPPLPVIKAMSERFPSLRFELDYYEGAMAFCGHYRCGDGDVIENSSGDYFGERGG